MRAAFGGAGSERAPRFTLPARESGSPPRCGRFAPARGGLGGRRDFIAPARAAEVVSSNIVGYEKITIKPGMNLIGNQFLVVGGTTFQNINEMFKDQSGFVAGSGDDNADSILTWDGSAYSDIYYLDDYTEPYEWYNTDDVMYLAARFGTGCNENGTGEEMRRK